MHLQTNMRIFNPCKPHICEFSTGGYAVRKFQLSTLRWVYLDTDYKFYPKQWWPKAHAYHACTGSPELAVDRLKTYYNNINKPFSKLYAY